MVAIQEYRLVLPFTLEEFEIAQLYMVAKFSASESSGDSGDGVEILKNEPFEEEDRNGQYTHKVYHLASKLPSWLVSLLPKKALILEEEAWNAYPHCTTVLKCPFLNKFKLVLETTHVADRGNTENALNLDPKSVKKRQVEYIDIATDEVENYVADEDPMLFKSAKTGRGPLAEGWQKSCTPVMCAYKLVTVDVPYWGFGGRIEKFITKTAQRKILLEGHRKCFCWLDEWFGLTMEDIRKMEAETAEAIARVRALALQRAQQRQDCDASYNGALEGENLGVPDFNLEKDDSVAILLPKSSLSQSNSIRGSLRRKPSLVGPAFSVGISTVSASDLEESGDPDFSVNRSAPPRPSASNDWEASQPDQHRKSRDSKAMQNANLTRANSSESFNSSHNVSSWDASQYSSRSSSSIDEESALEVAKCVDILDRAIRWAKTLKSSKKGLRNGSKTSVVAPIYDKVGSRMAREVDEYIDVLDSALSVVRKRPLKASVH